MERKHKKPFIPVHLKIVIRYLPFRLREEENIPYTSGSEFL